MSDSISNQSISAKLDMNSILQGRRMRRNRRTFWSRDLVRESSLQPSDLIWPIFIIEGKNTREPVASMPNVDRLSIDLAIKAARDAHKLGIPVIALFPNISPKLRDENGTEALNSENLICRACHEIKSKVPEIGIMTDVALDPYTSHGHDGLMQNEEILNDETVSVLIQQALNQSKAGADIIAPSDMMDGRVGAIRKSLDDSGLNHIQIMAYTAKYASAFYGPFRDAIGTNATLVGDKRTYQMDPANTDEALLEAELDIKEGADMIMIKPGLPYLDILFRLKQTFKIPTFAYQVSGEYAMICAAGQNNWLDQEKTMLESLLSFKRAGANGILTYFAPTVASLLQNQRKPS